MKLYIICFELHAIYSVYVWIDGNQTHQSGVVSIVEARQKKCAHFSSLPLFLSFIYTQRRGKREVESNGVYFNLVKMSRDRFLETLLWLHQSVSCDCVCAYCWCCSHCFQYHLILRESPLPLKWKASKTKEGREGKRDELGKFQFWNQNDI